MRSFFRVLIVFFLVAWMGVIFYFSHQPAAESSETSGKVIEVIAEKVYPDFENLSLEEKADVISSFQFIARKSAHIGTFFVLGFLAFLTFISYVKLHFFTRGFWAIIVSCVYAAGDEFHQRFIPGRSCELRDFLLDAAGILAAVLICTVFVKIIGPLRRKTAFLGRSRKELTELNTELFEKLDDTSYEKRQLEKQLKEKEDTIIKQEQTIEKLEKELDEQVVEVLEANAKNAQLRSEVENKVVTETALSDEMKYASASIGKVVIEVTKVCNKLGDSADNQNKKELINLALGRSEVFKAQVLNILQSEVDFETKKNMIKTEEDETFDYFNSIIAQMC